MQEEEEESLLTHVQNRYYCSLPIHFDQSKPAPLPLHLQKQHRFDLLHETSIQRHVSAARRPS
jgi:hypothetical protein